MTESEQKSKKAYTMWILLAISVLPIAAAYFIYFTGIGMPDTTVNSGQLLPRAELIKSLMSEEEWQEIEADKKWRLLIPVPENCDKVCRANLYTTRQVHIRLSEKSIRLERLALVLGQNYVEGTSQKVKDALQVDHPHLRFLSSGSKEWSEWKTSIHLPPNSSVEQEKIDNNQVYFLVDQEGRAMMVYSETQHGNEVLKDIKRALKYSIDYQ